MRCRTSPLLALAGSVTLILAIIPAMSAASAAQGLTVTLQRTTITTSARKLCAEPASVAKKFVQAHFDVPAPAKRATSGESISGTTYLAGARTWLGSASESGRYSPLYRRPPPSLS